MKNRTGKIHYEDGRWVVSFLDEKLMSAKGELGWAKSNLRRNVKVQKLGLRVFEVVDEKGKVVEVFDLDLRVQGKVQVTPKVKVEKRKVQKPVKIESIKKAEVETPKSDQKIRVVGQKGGQLEGYENWGTFVERSGRIIVINFKSAQDGGIGINYEFNAKDGVQDTHNPYHKWVIADLEAVI